MPPGTPPPLRAKTMAEPSGVHVIIDEGAPGGRVTGSVQSPDVSRFAAPPAAGTIHTCVGGTGAVMKRWKFSCTSNESFQRWYPGFFSGTSAVAKPIVAPSGDHASCCTPLVAVVSCLASPPLLDTTKICAPGWPGTGPVERNAICWPFGDHRGKDTLTYFAPSTTS